MARWRCSTHIQAVCEIARSHDSRLYGMSLKRDEKCRPTHVGEGGWVKAPPGGRNVGDVRGSLLVFWFLHDTILESLDKAGAQEQPLSV